MNLYEDNKFCTKCGKAFPKTAEFFYSKGQRLSSICKGCDIESASEYQKAHRAERTAYVREYRKRKKGEATPLGESTGVTVTVTNDCWIPAQDSHLRDCRICGETKELSTEFFYFRRDRNKFETACKKCLNQQAVKRKRNAPKKEVDPDVAASRRYRRQKTRKERVRRMSREEQAARKKKLTEYNKGYKERKLAAYLAEHGSMPLCGCGCGEEVKMDERGKPRKFAGVNHHFRLYDFHEINTEQHEKRREKQNTIPIEKFRAGVLKFKEELGMSYPQLSEAGGWNKGQLNCYMYDKRLKSIGRQLGEDFFKRLKGIPTEPSTYMKRKFAEAERNRNRIIAAQDMKMLGDKNVQS